MPEDFDLSYEQENSWSAGAPNVSTKAEICLRTGMGPGAQASRGTHQPLVAEGTTQTLTSL